MTFTLGWRAADSLGNGGGILPYTWMSGFAVVLSQPDTLYERCHWLVRFTSIPRMAYIGRVRPEVELDLASASRQAVAVLGAVPQSIDLGAISGTVTDSLGTPVRYATVVVQGLTIGAFTGADGTYTLRGIPAGRYTVITRLMGYVPESSAGVRVEPGRSTVVNFKLVQRRPVPEARLAGLTEYDSLLIAGGRRFALELYAQLARAPGNLLFSPYSVRTALEMVYAGARGRTERQMATALQDELGRCCIATAASELDRGLRAAGAGLGPANSELRTARGVWVADDIRLDSAFVDTLQMRYGAAPQRVDFAQGPAARATVNDWAEQQTHGRIHGLIPPGAPGPARLVLCDAIYFRGAWREAFPSGETEDGPFFVSGRDSVIVPLMHAYPTLWVTEDRELQVVELPYQKGGFAMLIILPRTVGGLSSVERELDLDSLDAWDSRMSRAVVHLVLPKFRIERALRLAGPLARMGMHDAFTKGADFSGIAREQPLFIGDNYHKSVVTVDENGTEAAGGTAVAMTKGLISRPLPWRDFIADHPFLFLIRHRPSGTILFMGRVADPRR